MYIEKYWHNYIGDTDDSLTLLDYFVEKGKAELALAEIISDTGLDKLNGDYTQTTVPLEFHCSNGTFMDFHFAIDIITDLAALLLECKKNGSISLQDLDADNNSGLVIHITASQDEVADICKALQHFYQSPKVYDLSEMMPESDVTEMAAIVEALWSELSV